MSTDLGAASAGLATTGNTPAGTTRGRTARSGKRRKGRSRDYGLVVLAAPAVILLVVFAYGPMAGLVVAFQDFNVADGVFGSPWIGLENFEFFFTSGGAGRILWNTLFLNILFLAATLGAGVVLAIMLNGSAAA